MQRETELPDTAAEPREAAGRSRTARTTLPTMQRGAAHRSLASHEDYISQKAPRGGHPLSSDGAPRALPAGNGSPQEERRAR